MNGMPSYKVVSFPSSIIFSLPKRIGGAACTVRERETGRQGSQISEVWLCCWQRAPLHYSPPCLDPWEYFGITTHYIYVLHYSVWYGRIVEVGLCVYFIMTNATLVLLMYMPLCDICKFFVLQWRCLEKFEQVWTSLKKFEHGLVQTNLNELRRFFWFCHRVHILNINFISVRLVNMC